MNSSNNPVLFLSRTLNEKAIFVQILVGIFLYINCLMIFTFFKKEAFRKDTRYILFAQTLFADCAVMIFTNMMFLGNYFQYAIHKIPCCFFCIIVNFLACLSPLTVVAMCLERYVAICLPLRHADISTNKNRLYGLLTICILSSIIPVFYSVGFLVQTADLFSYAVCNMEAMVPWLAYSRLTLYQILFLVLAIVIIFIYIKIMNAAKAASAEKMKSTSKSLRTVLLHAFQLFLSIMQYLYPYILVAFPTTTDMVFINVRYSFYVVFMITPRCLGPLIYGLRDEKFFLVLKHYAILGLYRKCKQNNISPTPKIKVVY